MWAASNISANVIVPSSSPAFTPRDTGVGFEPKVTFPAVKRGVALACSGDQEEAKKVNAAVAMDLG